MLYLEQKYISLVSSRLRNFKKKSSSLYNFSCPLCMDSRVNERKARGYVYLEKNQLKFCCHNCGQMMWFESFLKRIDERLWSDLQFEKVKFNPKLIISEEVVEKKTNLDKAYQAFLQLKKISHLQPSHPASQYMRKRMIPSAYLDEFRFSQNFQEWTNSVYPGKFSEESLKYDAGRIVMPVFTRDKKFFAYQGRVIENNEVRYIAINLDSDLPMIFNLEKVDFSKLIYAFEGPLDSTFIPNSVAHAGANFAQLTKHLPRDKIVMVWDNEPYSIDLKKKMRRSIEQGLNMVIWPNNIHEKDVNEMIMAGMSQSYIEYILAQNTHDPWVAKTRLAAWSHK